MRLGLYGGSFDPVHRGHLEAAERAIRELRLDRLLWLPAGDPPHKRRRLTSPAHRVRMLELALTGRPRMAVCEAELTRPGPTYTVDTLRAFERLLPAAELHFLIGADSLLDLPAWREPGELLRHRIVVVPRPGFDLDSIPPALRRRVRLLSGPRNAVASRDLRARLASGRDPGDLVPPAVAAYIRLHRLYRRPAA